MSPWPLLELEILQLHPLPLATVSYQLGELLLIGTVTFQPVTFGHLLLDLLLPFLPSLLTTMTKIAHLALALCLCLGIVSAVGVSDGTSSALDKLPVVGEDASATAASEVEVERQLKRHFHPYRRSHRTYLSNPRWGSSMIAEISGGRIPRKPSNRKGGKGGKGKGCRARILKGGGKTLKGGARLVTDDDADDDDNDDDVANADDDDAVDDDDDFFVTTTSKSLKGGSKGKKGGGSKGLKGGKGLKGSKSNSKSWDCTVEPTVASTSEPSLEPTLEPTFEPSANDDSLTNAPVTNPNPAPSRAPEVNTPAPSTASPTPAPTPLV